jgi:hypothetical protein
LQGGGGFTIVLGSFGDEWMTDAAVVKAVDGRGTLEKVGWDSADSKRW